MKRWFSIFRVRFSNSYMTPNHSRPKTHGPTTSNGPKWLSQRILSFSLSSLLNTHSVLSPTLLCLLLLLIPTLSVKRHCSFACLCSTSPFTNNNAIRGTLMLSSLSSFHHLNLSPLPSQLQEPSALFALFPFSTKNRYFHLPP